MPYKSAAQRKAVWASRNEQAAKKKRKRKKKSNGNRTTKFRCCRNEH